jgi:hypothetical protein
MFKWSMSLTLLENLRDARGPQWRFLALAGAAVALMGCISATTPILGDANAILGEQGQLHLFSNPGSLAREHSVLSFQWSGSRYVFSGSGSGISDFTVHPFEGRDLIVQSTAARAPKPTEFAIARKLADGVYMIIPISEEDADDATRDRFCTKTQDASCRITTPEQLFVFARATAAKEEEAGAIAVIVPGKPR